MASFVIYFFPQGFGFALPFFPILLLGFFVLFYTLAFCFPFTKRQLELLAFAVIFGARNFPLWNAPVFVGGWTTS